MLLLLIYQVQTLTGKIIEEKQNTNKKLQQGYKKVGKVTYALSWGKYVYKLLSTRCCLYR